VAPQPENFRIWSRVIRDTTTYLLGVFILLYELLSAHDPSVYWIGTGVALLGVAPVLRLNEKTAEEDDHA
jgi:hypothetical protein